MSTALGTIENFGNFSGPKLNDKKTEALWIRSMVGKKKKLLPEKNFKWPEKKKSKSLVLGFLLTLLSH